MMSPELLEELKAALVRKEEARERWAKLELEAGEARAVALEAKKDFRAVCDELEEIESEIRTGLTGMPLVDAAKVPSPRREPWPEMPDGSPMPPAEAVERAVRDAAETAESIDDELHAALFPAGVDSESSPWRPFRGAGGITDRDVVAVLAGLWPERMAFRSDSEEGPGHTVRGGKAPAFWLGDVGPGKLPPPDLIGAEELGDAVRRVLHLRKFEDDDQADVDVDDEKAVKAAAARFYRPPSKADERPVKPAKGSKRGASSAAVGAAAATTP